MRKMTENNNLVNTMLADDIIEKAIKLLPSITYNPDDIAYFVKQDDVDMGDANFCYKCIIKEIYRARRYNKECRLNIIKKFEEIENTGFFNGVNIKEKYPDLDLVKAKKDELKRHPLKTKFTFEGHDPDFGGGENEPLCCFGCGEYFYTNFEPDLDCAKRLLQDLNDEDLLKKKYREKLIRKLGIAFGNYKYCEANAKEILLQCAEIVIKTYT